MGIIFGAIPTIIAFMGFYGYYKSSRVKLKNICFRIPILILLSFAAIVVMIKWYEVPIHHNRITYVGATSSTSYKKLEGSTKICIKYNYNTYKGIKELGYGYPLGEEIYPGIYIETLIKARKDTSDYIKHSFGGSSTTYYHGSDTILRCTYDYIHEGRNLLLSDSAAIDYLRNNTNCDFNNNDFAGTQLVVDVYSANRQHFYPFSISNSKKYRRIITDSIFCSRLLLPDTLPGIGDTVKLHNLVSYSIPYKRTKNSIRATKYCYIPPADSIIYQYYFLNRYDYKEPNIFFTAEDISRAVEILWIEGVNEPSSNIEIKELSFDYIGPAEFSDMNPEPDIKDVSRIVFKEAKKIDEILHKGLRFHVKFPDMENIQQMRMFGVTLVVGGLLGLLFGCLYTLCVESYKRGLLKIHLSQKASMALYISIFLFFFLLFSLCAYYSHIDAFDLYNNNSWNNFSIIEDFE